MRYLEETADTRFISLGEVKAGRGSGWDISGFKYMKACCENHGEQMFSLFTKDKTKQGMPLPLAQGTLNENLGETILTENVGTWDYFNKNIQRLTLDNL